MHSWLGWILRCERKLQLVTLIPDLAVTCASGLAGRQPIRGQLPWLAECHADQRIWLIRERVLRRQISPPATPDWRRHSRDSRDSCLEKISRGQQMRSRSRSKCIPDTTDTE